MENPINIQPVEDSTLQTDKRKNLVWSILVGLFYGIPALLIGFLVAFILMFLLLVVLLPSIFPSLGSSSFASSSIGLDVMFGVSAVSALVSALIAGIISGRASYKKITTEGGFRRTGYSLAAFSCAGLLGILIFPFLCDAGLLGIGALLNALQLDYLLSGFGTESGVTVVFFLCGPAIGFILAYPAAILVGAVISKLLKGK